MYQIDLIAHNARSMNYKLPRSTQTRLNLKNNKVIDSFIKK